VTHHCHAIDCTAEVPPSLLCCKRHWFMVPVPLRIPVLRTYRRGQCHDKRPSPAYCEAAANAIEHVARLEGKTVEAIAKMRGAYQRLGELSAASAA
jgi:hypothetical protein